MKNVLAKTLIALPIVASLFDQAATADINAQSPAAQKEFSGKVLKQCMDESVRLIGGTKGWATMSMAAMNTNDYSGTFLKFSVGGDIKKSYSADFENGDDGTPYMVVSAGEDSKIDGKTGPHDVRADVLLDVKTLTQLYVGIDAGDAVSEQQQKAVNDNAFALVRSIRLCATLKPQ